MNPVESLALLGQTPALLYPVAILFGLIIGSFLNVVILRLPRIMEQEWQQDCAALAAAAPVQPEMAQPEPAEPASNQRASAQPATDPASAPPRPLSLAWPPSSCPQCGARIAPWDNLPVLSWLLLRGRCRACHGPIATRYPIIEALTALLTVLVIWQFGLTWQGGAALLLTWGLIALAFIDLDTQLLPDSITLPLLWLGLLLSLTGLFTNSTDAILGAAAGYLSLWLVFHAFRLLTGKDGMGRGDFKLLALFGAWFGWQVLPQVVLFSAIPGAIVGVALIATGRQDSQQPIPYGPFLAIAGWVSLMWGNAITDAYLRWSGLGGY